DTFEVRGFRVFYLVNVVPETGGRKRLIEAFEPSINLRKDLLVPGDHKDRVHPVHVDEANRSAAFGQAISCEDFLEVAHDIPCKVVFDRQKPDAIPFEDLGVEDVDEVEQFAKVTAPLAEKQNIAGFVTHKVGAFTQIRREQLGHFGGRNKFHADDLNHDLVVGSGLGSLQHGQG